MFMKFIKKSEGNLILQFLVGEIEGFACINKEQCKVQMKNGRRFVFDSKEKLSDTCKYLSIELNQPYLKN
jgi:hypothetical protein